MHTLLIKSVCLSISQAALDLEPGPHFNMHLLHRLVHKFLEVCTITSYCPEVVWNRIVKMKPKCYVIGPRGREMPHQHPLVTKAAGWEAFTLATEYKKIERSH